MRKSLNYINGPLKAQCSTDQAGILRSFIYQREGLNPGVGKAFLEFMCRPSFELICVQRGVTHKSPFL